MEIYSPTKHYWLKETKISEIYKFRKLKKKDINLLTELEKRLYFNDLFMYYRYKNEICLKILRVAASITGGLLLLRFAIFLAEHGINCF